MPIDVARARAETPGCEQVIHFNNAGASLQPGSVLAEVQRHLELESQVGGYEAAELEAERIEDVYVALAELLGATAGEIALTESATRALDSVLYSMPLRPGDRIHASTHEYASNFIPLMQISRRTGAVIEVMSTTEDGLPDLHALESSLDKRSAMIMLTHVPASSGTVNPVAAVGAIARRAGTIFIVDACQSAGQVPLDVGAIGCDFLVGTGRKYLRGPRGTGFLYARSGALDGVEPATLDYHAADWSQPRGYAVREDARRYEVFEYAVAARLGLGAAVRYALELGVPGIAARVSALGARMREYLGQIPGVELLDRGPELCGIVGFRVAGRGSADVRKQLRDAGMNTWVVGASATRLDLEPRGIPDLVRASVHYYNTEDEVERFCREVAAWGPSGRRPNTDLHSAPAFN